MSALATSRMVVTVRIQPDKAAGNQANWTDEYDLVGTTVAGKYRIVRVASSGGFGIVYEALSVGDGLNTGQGFPKALKFLRLDPSLDHKKMTEALHKEVQLLTMLSARHAGIVQAHDLGIHTCAKGALPYLVMEWLDGQTLASYIASLNGVAVPIQSAVALLAAAAEALADAHQLRVAHLDIKPANLFLVGPPSHCRIKVLDLGLAEMRQEHAHVQIDRTGPGSPFAFTPPYGAPEQFAPLNFDGGTGPWTDVFALALVVVELVVGTRALRGTAIKEVSAASMDRASRPTPASFGVKLDQRVEAVLEQALAVRPQDRYANMRLFWDALTTAIDASSGVVRKSERRPASLPPQSTDVYGETHRPRRIFYAYHSTDEDFRADLEERVKRQCERLTAEWQPIRITGSSSGDSIPNDSILLLLVSGAFVDSRFCHEQEMRDLLQRHKRGAIRVVPILIDTIDWGWQRPLEELVALPRFSIPITKWADRTAAWASVTESLRAILHDKQDSDVRRARSEPPAVVRVHDVFKKSGAADVTFVETQAYMRLVSCLQVPGRGIVIEGPSGVGKTTALKHAIDHLRKTSDDVRDVELLAARKKADLERIRSITTWHTKGIVAIDDFHRLYSSGLAGEIADYMKSLADDDSGDKKVVIAGVPGSGQQLVNFGTDLAMRMDVLRFGPAPLNDVYSMIGKGEKALNIVIERKADIAVAASGSFNLAQYMCASICDQNNVSATLAETMLLRWTVSKTLRAIVEEVKRKIHPLLEAFSRIGDHTDLTYLQILQELPACEDGYLSLQALGARRRRSIDVSRVSSDLEVACEKLDDLIFYDRQAKALVVEDPQVLFFLAHEEERRIAQAMGKRPPGDRTRVFIHYSTHDEHHAQDVKRYLKPLENREMDLEEGKVVAGMQWRLQIEKMLSEASVVVLCVSGDYLGMVQKADLFERLLSEARDRGVLVLPLAIKSVQAQHTPWARFDPASTTAFAEASRHEDREAICRAAIERIRSHVSLQSRV